jgi:hypothetical protein
MRVQKDQAGLSAGGPALNPAAQQQSESSRSQYWQSNPPGYPPHGMPAYSSNAWS